MIKVTFSMTFIEKKSVQKPLVIITNQNTLVIIFLHKNQRMLSISKQYDIDKKFQGSKTFIAANNAF